MKSPIVVSHDEALALVRAGLQAAGLPTDVVDASDLRTQTNVAQGVNAILLGLQALGWRLAPPLRVVK